MKNNTVQIIVGLVLAALLIVVADLLPFWMPNMMQTVVLVAIAVLLIVWAGFVMNEHAHDERESLHTMHAGRIAYLSGVGMLTIALIKQGLAHAVDPWIPMTLAVMILSKIIARLYIERYN